MTLKTTFISHFLTNNRWFQVNKHSSRYMFASSRLTEEGVEGIITPSNGLVTRHLTIRLDTVFQAVQLPAGIAHLDSRLTNMDRYTLTLQIRNTNV